jgi:hypothetical protein
MDLASRGSVSGPAAAIVRCQQLNRVLGTNLGPWDLAGIPDEWLTALDVWTEGLPKVQEWKRESKAALERVRNRGKVQ